MNYPLFFTYSAYNNELEGINVIMDTFNGFMELQKRDFAAEKLIDYYSAMKVEVTNFNQKSNNTILHLGYIELVIASGKIPNMFDARNLEDLENAASSKFMEKLNRTDIYSMFSVRKSLLVGAKITLQKISVSNDEKILLENFIKSGGMVESTQYADVSKIINL